MTSMAMGWRFGAELADALGLPKERVGAVVIRVEPGAVVAVDVRLYPTQEQTRAIIALAREAMPDIRIARDREWAALRIARQALAAETL